MEQSPNFDPVRRLLIELGRLRDHLSPERECLFGAVVTYASLVLLLSPEKTSQQLQPLIELFEITNSQVMASIKMTTLIGLVGSVDGARRIVQESLPLYKAYLQVFLLNKFDFDDEE